MSTPLQNPAAVRIELRRMSAESPPASHIEKPRSFWLLIKSPLDAKECASSKDTITCVASL